MGMKKPFNAKTFYLSGAVWTVFYVGIFFLFFWTQFRFNVFDFSGYFSRWKSFLEGDLVIDSFGASIAVLWLIFLLPLWMWGWHLCYRFDIIKILGYPIFCLVYRKRKEAIKDTIKSKIQVKKSKYVPMPLYSISKKKGNSETVSKKQLVMESSISGTPDVSNILDPNYFLKNAATTSDEEKLPSQQEQIENDEIEKEDDYFDSEAVYTQYTTNSLRPTVDKIQKWATEKGFESFIHVLFDNHSVPMVVMNQEKVVLLEFLNIPDVHWAVPMEKNDTFTDWFCEKGYKQSPLVQLNYVSKKLSSEKPYPKIYSTLVLCAGTIMDRLEVQLFLEENNVVLTSLDKTNEEIVPLFDYLTLILEGDENE